MKRLLLATILILSALTMQAQPRCAVFQFQAGTGVNNEDIDGISYMFRAYFTPSNYKVIPHEIVVKKVTQLGYKQTGMNPQQLLKVGRDLDALVIVVGTLNKFMDEYSVTIDAIRVEDNWRLASETATFARSEYRGNIKTLTQNLVGKLGGGSSSGSGQNGSGTSSNSSQNGAKTSTSTQVQTDYTDLGLPSGTIWKNFNATGFYTYDEAFSQFGNRLPSKAQWEELKAECQWTWNGSGYKVTGPNGNSIVLPAAGFRDCSGSVGSVGSYGNYCSSTPDGSGSAWYVGFVSSSVGVHSGDRCYSKSVRLVQD